MYRVPVAVIGFTDLGWTVKYPKRMKGILQVGLYPEKEHLSLTTKGRILQVACFGLRLFLELFHVWFHEE